MEQGPDAVKTGTSTIGITFNGGVVVGADHRATMGHFVANKSVQKLFKIGAGIKNELNQMRRSRKSFGSLSPASSPKKAGISNNALLLSQVSGGDL